MKKENYARLNYYDVWFPDLAPSQDLVSRALSETFTDQQWAQWARSYRAEMRDVRTQRLIALLAALSHQTDLSVGCYCENEARCHRSVLRELLREHGADVRA